MAATTPIFQQTAALKGHSDNINVMKFSNDGKYLATGGDDAQVIIFDTHTWKVYKRYTMVSPVRALVWHKEDDVLSWGLRNGVVHTIILKNDSVHFDHAVHGIIHCMSFNAQGKILAIGFNNEVLITRQSTICEQLNSHIFLNDTS
ncbi:WD40-repeat-containing domain protein [Mycena galopus ATCC 62051]|nr:WD40-repeat-containing domain protein [Mycena galopus ATCC 62051]